MSLFEFVRNEVAHLEHARNLRGMAKAKCTKCGGSGESEPSRSDCDSHGSYWVPAVACLHCRNGFVEVPCSPEAEAAAIGIEIERLKARLKEVRARTRKGRRV